MRLAVMATGLMGKKVGDKVEIQLPRTVQKLQIVRIEDT